MSTTAAFKTLGIFPFSVAASHTSGKDEIQLTGLSLSDAMKYYWLIESVRLQTSWSGTETSLPVSGNIDYTFTKYLSTIKAPYKRVVPERPIFETVVYPNGVTINGVSSSAQIGLTWGESPYVAKPSTYSFNILLQNGVPAGIVLADAFVISLDSAYDPRSYTLRATTTFTLEGQTFTIYLYGFNGDGPQSISSFSFSLTPAYYTF